MNPLVACLAFFTMTNLTVGGTGYEVTAQQDGKPVTYMVNFGGEFNFEQYTAYDPVSKKIHLFAMATKCRRSQIGQPSLGS